MSGSLFPGAGSPLGFGAPTNLHRWLAAVLVILALVGCVQTSYATCSPGNNGEYPTGAVTAVSAQSNGQRKSTLAGLCMKARNGSVTAGSV